MTLNKLRLQLISHAKSEPMEAWLENLPSKRKKEKTHQQLRSSDSGIGKTT
ncbi:predicted protein [Plenodomus lingam JN3]|uniref:Predicted protein n=1 Tax=Leptosphaeria maculans (strain JN3 / isolate v23.1.3 / race Av1-4-5-6-7-8) TaxID=985895 RepID=E5A274_LEPMJ|nr:predicted protein [Plenodomus lingam JN3]CBX97951.1 predicted protein [Plenodomus lingam JN3]